MKYSILLIACLSFGCPSTILAGETKPTVDPVERPNILFIFADDQCFNCVHALGNSEVRTPNLDRLVESGTTFTHAYNMGAWNGAVCIASRTSLNTGRFLWNAANTDLKQAVTRGSLWPQLMKQAGYETYMAGKWHVQSKTYHPSPEDLFDFTGTLRPGMPEQTEACYNRSFSEGATDWLPWDREYGGYWEGGEHWSEVLAAEAVEFLRQAASRDKPFFMYLAFNAPHDPRQSPMEYVEQYPLDGIEVPPNFLPEYPYADQVVGKRLRDERLAPYPRTERSVKINRREYYALITHLDAQIGRILDALQRTDGVSNTWIFFTADHGLAVGQHGFMGKQNMYDHSLRAPFIVAGPGVKANARIETPIYLQDVMPTTLELAGLQKRSKVDFGSLLPLLSRQTRSHYPAIYGAYMEKQRMLLAKDHFKLIHYPRINVYRLFNTESDPWEMNDLAHQNEYRERLETMKADLTKLQLSMNDPLLAARQE